MSLGYDLLEQSKSLATAARGRPKQANLRRAISSAYYAIYHLLSSETARLFVREPDFVNIGSLIQRTLVHREMKRASASIADGKLPEGIQPDGLSFQPTPHLKLICKTFIKLQELRHLADYDTSQQFSMGQTLELIRDTERAFAAWDIVRNSDEARLYLACFLLWDTWKKPAR